MNKSHAPPSKSFSNSKGILKNTSLGPNSLANTHGIVRKPGYQENLGLTPNFNVEDEYVENLLKQIHFMNLEVKLLKEKQDDNKGKLGVAGLIKDGKPITDHVIISQNKFKDMKQELTKNIVKTQANIMNEDEQSDIHEARKQYLDELIELLKQEHDTTCQELDQVQSEVRAKLMVETKRQEALEADIAKIKGTYKKILEDHTKLTKEQSIKNMNKDLSNKMQEEEENLDKEDLEQKEKLEKQLQSIIDQKKLEMEQDVKYIELNKINKDLKGQLKKVEQELEDTKYESHELEHLCILSAKKQEEDQHERRRLSDELERVKLVLEEIQKANQLKIQKKLRETESQELKKKQIQQVKAERELQEVMQKFATADKNFRQFLTEMMHKTYYLRELEVPNKENENKYQDTIIQINKQDPILKKIQSAIDANMNKINELKEDKTNSLGKLRSLEDKNKQLQASYNYLKNHINLDNDLKQVNIEELRSMADQNNQVNHTISGFVEKWDQIRRFSRN